MQARLSPLKADSYHIQEMTYRTTVTSLDDQTQVRRERTTIACTSSLLVGVWGRQVVGKLAGASEHLAFIVGAILILDLLC